MRVSAAQLPPARAFFSPRGLLSQWHPHFEFRAGQAEMAEAVEAALQERRHLIVEAGTGTGKTLAYLVPAILSGRRIVVSTATKNLQEQLFLKDVPFLQQHFSQPLRVCYMKGRANYLCLQKLFAAESAPLLDGLEEMADFEQIRRWAQHTETGDRAEISQLPEDSTAWTKLDARRERCSGQRCPQFERCFITRMHQRAQESDVIIVNHHLLFADLAVKDEDFGGILPEYTALILDEAHEIEDIAGNYFGLTVSNYQVLDLAQDLAAVSRQKQFASAELERNLVRLQESADRFFGLFGEAEGRRGFDQHDSFLRQYGQQYEEMLAALERIWTVLELIPNTIEEILPLLRRARDLHSAIRFWMESRDGKFVYWTERRGRGCFLQATPIDVSELLREKLFERLDTVILTSATLTVASSFDYVQSRLGIPGARTLEVASQFDYQRQALFYVPEHLPDPRSPGFLEQACQEIWRLLRASRGRAFVLFTSYQQMRAAYERLSARVDFPLLLQGAAPRHTLLEKFRETPHAVLFATSSFWQGVDVPGEQLSCVIIDRLPFAVPTDPVVEARMRFIRESGGNPFYDYQIPQAAIALKQGFGRLIRSRSDRGVLALLDNRIIKQRYGQVFFDSLPSYRFTRDWTEVEKFFHV
ncbi:MAG: DEAD/DEAH box helicase [Bryobacteraceae bacterium]|nr:DEAD/DEAH box helicase [Bryobacteraceae bacterium]MDW8380030.1 helicase C-terminal domain-containing protein [Bryobacterales bacterium]